MLQLGLGFLDFRRHVDETAERNGKFVGADHEGRGGSVFLGHCVDALQVRHLRNHGIERLEGVFADDLQFELLLRGDIFLRTNHAHTADDLLHLLDVVDEFGFFSRRSVEFQALAHDAFSVFSVVEVLPQFLGDERHKRMQHFQECIEEFESFRVGFAVNGLCLAVDIRRLHHFEVPRRKFVPEQFIDGHQSL